MGVRFHRLYSPAPTALIGIPSGKHFPIRYNPDLPTDHTHDHATATPNPRNAILTIGIVGSIVLSLAWLFVLRGCN